MRKKITIVAMIVCIIMLFTACGSNQANQTNQSNVEEPTEESANGEVITITVGHVVPESHPSHITLGLGFKEYVERESNGRIKVEVYPNGQLGGERQQVEAVSLGTLDMSIPASSVVANFDEKFLVFDLPFLFKTREAALEACDGDFGKKVAEGLESLNMINLGYAENGFRFITNNVRPIRKPEDLKGIKIRTMENPIHVETFKALGANPTPMAFGELYTALQQKTVDAQENPVGLIYTNKFYEVQKYMSLTGHVFVPCPYIINKQKYESLPDDLQKVIADGVKISCDEQRKLLAEEADRMFKEIEESGTVINDLTAEEKEAFIKTVEPIYEDFIKKYGSELVDEARKYNQ